MSTGTIPWSLGVDQSKSQHAHLSLMFFQKDNPLCLQFVGKRGKPFIVSQRRVSWHFEIDCNKVNFDGIEYDYEKQHG